jgi:hypothetical protein
MPRERTPHPVLVVNANEELKRCRALMLEQNQELLKNISASRDLLAQATETLAEADRVLEWWQQL